MAGIRNVFLLLLLLLQPVLLRAQSDNLVNRDVKLKNAATFFNSGWFRQSAEEYIKLLPAIEDNAEALNVLGMSWFYLGDFEKASVYLKRSIAIDPEGNPERILQNARSFHYRMLFDSALAVYSQYINANEKKNLQFNREAVQKFMEECNSGKALKSSRGRYNITSLDTAINSYWADYGPYFADRGELMFFTSQRENEDFIIPDEGFIPDDDVFFSERVNGKWTDAVKIPVPFNSKYNTSCVGSTYDGKKLFIVTEENNGDILQTSFNDSILSEPVPLKGIINTQSTENSITFNKTNTRCYFVSNRKDIENFGGMDIYTAVIDRTGSWGDIRNLGGRINTKYDEATVFYDTDSSYLYFSSTGHNTVGGYDIFRVKVTDSTMESEVTNMGLSINSAFDDHYYTVSDSIAYFSSFRPQRLEEIFSYNINNIIPEEELPIHTILPVKVFQPYGEYYYSLPFRFDKIAIVDKSGILDTLATWMNNNPSVLLTIKGHTDNRGPSEYNERLSANRALAAKSYIVGKGVAPERITTIGLGSQEPIARTDFITWEDIVFSHSLNRRLELILNNQDQEKFIIIKQQLPEEKFRKK